MYEVDGLQFGSAEGVVTASNDKSSETAQKSLLKGSLISIALDQLGLKRYCCRRMLLSHVNLIDQLLNYNSRITSLQNRRLINCLYQIDEPIIQAATSTFSLLL